VRNERIKPENLKKITQAEWLEALRSGNYEQAANVMYDQSSDGFCCLGVAAHLAGVPLDEYPCTWIETSNLSRLVESEILQDPIGNMIGMSRHQQGELAGLNDRGVPFADIADYVEKNEWKCLKNF
jgi:hypothetical protein